MTTPTLLPPIVYSNQVHRPLGSNEAVDPASIALSARDGNLIQRAPDGLYVGLNLDQPTYYIDGNAGVDIPTSCPKGQPYKTLEYCLYQLNAKSPNLRYYCSTANVALKAGQTYTFDTTFINGGDLTFTFWGDTKYGDFDSPYIGSPGTDPALMEDLHRPVIMPIVSAQNGL